MLRTEALRGKHCLEGKAYEKAIARMEMCFQGIILTVYCRGVGHSGISEFFADFLLSKVSFFLESGTNLILCPA